MRVTLKKNMVEEEELDLTLFFNAIEKKEIELWYQPQYDLQSREIVGFESLLRWKPNGKDYISPLDLVHFVEENGLITDLDIYVVNKVCDDFNALLEVPFVNKDKLRIAMNISGKSFKDKDIMTYLVYMICENELNPSNLEFELTETSYLSDKDIDSVAETVGKLREIGFSVALDDFGTGYSSLALLSRVSVDILKIDKSFLTGTEKVNKILDSVLFLTKSLGLRTVGEGIETSEQEDLLIAKGCDIGQGYLFSKPLPLLDLLSIAS